MDKAKRSKKDNEVEFTVSKVDIDPEEIKMLEEADPYGNQTIPKTEEEFNDFINRNRRLIHAILRPFRGLDDYDDLYQEASYGFYRGLSTYDPGKGIKITTDAFACGRNQVKMYLRKATAKSRTATVVSLDASFDPDDDRDSLLNKDLSGYDPMSKQDDLDDTIHKNIQYEKAAEIMSKFLDKNQQFVVHQFMKGIPQSKTAKILHTSQSEVSKIHKTSNCIIRLKMQEEGISGD